MHSPPITRQRSIPRRERNGDLPDTAARGPMPELVEEFDLRRRRELQACPGADRLGEHADLRRRTGPDIERDVGRGESRRGEPELIPPDLLDDEIGEACLAIRDPRRRDSRENAGSADERDRDVARVVVANNQGNQAAGRNSGHGHLSSARVLDLDDQVGPEVGADGGPPQPHRGDLGRNRGLRALRHQACGQRDGDLVGGCRLHATAGYGRNPERRRFPGARTGCGRRFFSRLGGRLGGLALGIVDARGERGAADADRRHGGRDAIGGDAGAAGAREGLVGLAADEVNVDIVLGDRARHEEEGALDGPNLPEVADPHQAPRRDLEHADVSDLDPRCRAGRGPDLVAGLDAPSYLYPLPGRLPRLLDLHDARDPVDDGHLLAYHRGRRPDRVDLGRDEREEEGGEREGGEDAAGGLVAVRGGEGSLGRIAASGRQSETPVSHLRTCSRHEPWSRSPCSCCRGSLPLHAGAGTRRSC